MWVLLYNVRSRLVNEGEPAEFAGTGRTFRIFRKRGENFFAKKFEVFYNGANDDTITKYHHGGLRPLFHGGKSK